MSRLQADQSQLPSSLLDSAVAMIETAKLLGENARNLELLLLEVAALRVSRPTLKVMPQLTFPFLELTNKMGQVMKSLERDAVAIERLISELEKSRAETTEAHRILAERNAISTAQDERIQWLGAQLARFQIETTEAYQALKEKDERDAEASRMLIARDAEIVRLRAELQRAQEATTAGDRRIMEMQFLIRAQIAETSRILMTRDAEIGGLRAELQRAQEARPMLTGRELDNALGAQLKEKETQLRDVQAKLKTAEYKVIVRDSEIRTLKADLEQAKDKRKRQGQAFPWLQQASGAAAAAAHSPNPATTPQDHAMLVDPPARQHGQP